MQGWGSLIGWPEEVPFGAKTRKKRGASRTRGEAGLGRGKGAACAWPVGSTVQRPVSAGVSTWEPGSGGAGARGGAENPSGSAGHSEEMWFFPRKMGNPGRA